MECIEALDTLAMFNSNFGRGRQTTDAVCQSTENLLEVAIWYSRRRIADGVLRVYETGMQASLEESGKPYRYGVTRFRRSLRGARTAITKEQPTWKLQLRRIEKLLQDYPAIAQAPN